MSLRRVFLVASLSVLLASQPLASQIQKGPTRVEAADDAPSPSESTSLRGLATRPGRATFGPGESPSPEQIEAIVEAGETLGYDLQPRHVVAAAVLFREGDSDEQKAEIVARVIPIILAALAASALIDIGFEWWEAHRENTPMTTRRGFKAAACGALDGLLLFGPLVKVGAKALKITTEPSAMEALGTSILIDVSTNVAGEFIEVLSEGIICSALTSYSYESLPACSIEYEGITVYTAPQMTTYTEDCVAQQVGDLYLGEATTLSQALVAAGIISDPVIPMGVTLTDGTNFTPVLQSVDVAQIKYYARAFATGSVTIKIGVINQGVEKIIHTNVFSAAPDDLLTGAFSYPAQSLVDLNVGTDDTFLLFMETRYQSDPPVQFLGKSGQPLGVRVAGTQNLLPLITLSADSSGGTIRFYGSYLDAEGDLPTILQLQIQGPGGSTNVDLKPILQSGAVQDGRFFETAIVKQNGVHTYRIVSSDGNHPQTTSAWEPIRVSTTPPHVTMALSKPTAVLGEWVDGLLTVTDAAGPIPGLEVGLQTDMRSPFRNSAGRMVRKLTTGANGTALFAYQPIVSGEHFVLAMEPGHEYGFDTLEVAGNPAGWTADWTWTRINGSDTQAEYEGHVFVLQPGGLQLDPGDYVYFSANHGSFQTERDQAGLSGIVDNRLLLTKTEADSGDEIITISLPKYDVSLTHVTNLPVGSGGPLSAVRTLQLAGESAGSGQSFGVSFSRDGRYAARLRSQGDVEIYNLSDLSVVRAVDPGGDDLTCLDFSPSGDQLVTGDEDGNLAVINVASGVFTRKSMTNGVADITNVEWYDADRIVAATHGVTGTNSFEARVLVVDTSLNLQTSPIPLAGVTGGTDIVRVTCNPVSQLCAAASFPGDGKWFLFSPSGTQISSTDHPDGNYYWAMAFNEAGNRLLVGGDDSGGAQQLELYAVSAGGKTPLTKPFSGNVDVFAASFFDESAQEHLAIGGNADIETFSAEGGGVLQSGPDPIGSGGSDTYHIEFIEGLGLLAAVGNSSQVFYNVSGDYFGPDLSLPQPPPIDFLQTSLNVPGNAHDDSGVSLLEYQFGADTWNPLAFNAVGDFLVALSPVPLGETDLVLRATDVHLNSTTISVPVARLDDDDAPLVSSVEATPGYGSIGGQVTIRADVTDFGAGVESVLATVRNKDQVTVASAPLAPAGGDEFSTVLNTSGYSGGIFRVDILATDLSAGANQSLAAEAASFALCSHPVDLLLSSQTVLIPTVFRGCATIKAGNAFVVASNVELRAGTSVAIEGGFSVQGGSLSVAVGPIAE